MYHVHERQVTLKCIYLRASPCLRIKTWIKYDKNLVEQVKCIKALKKNRRKLKRTHVYVIRLNELEGQDQRGLSHSRYARRRLIK